jgi:hypothetical protein
MPSGVRAIRPSSGAPTEIAIPWTALEGLAADSTATYHAVFYLIDAQNGIDAQWPPENRNGSDVAFSTFRSYPRAPGAVPSADATRSVRADGGIALDDEVYANVYLVPDAPQTVTLGTHTTVVGELFVGEKATLDVGTNGRDPSGHNRLRVGRRLAVEGTFEPREGVVLTFDPAEGYPPSIEPGSGFAWPSQPTEIAGGTFYALTLHNRTELVASAASRDSTHADSAQIVLRGPLTIAAGGRLHGRGVLDARYASSSDTSRANISATSPGDSPRAERSPRGSADDDGGWLDRVARFLRGDTESDGPRTNRDASAAEGGATSSGGDRSTDGGRPE